MEEVAVHPVTESLVTESLVTGTPDPDPVVTPDFTAQVEAKKGLAIGLGTGAAIMGLVGVVMGNWILAIIIGLVSGFLFARNATKSK